MNTETMKSLVDRFKVNVFKFAVVQEARPEHLILFSEVSFAKKDSIVFESMEIFKNNDREQGVLPKSCFEDLEPFLKDRIAVSVTEIQDDVKKFELRSRACAIQ